MVPIKWRFFVKFFYFLCTFYFIIEDNKEVTVMYITITRDKNTSDAYIKQSYHKENRRISSHIYKKLGKFNALIAQFNGDENQMLA